MRTYSALAVANYFIEKALAENRRGLDHLKLQKLLYFAQGWCLAIQGRPLLDEPIEAWQYGPVVATIYHKLKRYGGGPIPEVEPDLDDDHCWQVQKVPLEDIETRTLLEEVWKTYRRHSGVQLSAMTHQPGSPWDVVRKLAEAKGIRKGADIPNDLIEQAFVRRALEGRESA